MNGKENQMLVINGETGRLATSENGINWSDVGCVCKTNDSGDGWHVAPIHGKDRWCVARITGKVKYLINGTSTWETATDSVQTPYSMAYGDTFMVASRNGDAKGTEIRILLYGNGLWICGNQNGKVLYHLVNKEWVSVPVSWNSAVSEAHGGCYANGYFYVVDGTKCCAFRSANGKDWVKILGLDHVYYNIAYFGNKLYLLSSDGSHCHFGYFYPNDDGVSSI